MTHHNCTTTIKTSLSPCHIGANESGRRLLVSDAVSTEKRNKALWYRQHWSFFNKQKSHVSLSHIVWSVKSGAAIVRQRTRKATTTEQPTLLWLLYYGWIPTADIKDGVVGHHSSGSTGALLRQVGPKIIPPIWEVNRKRGKDSGEGSISSS